MPSIHPLSSKENKSVYLLSGSDGGGVKHEDDSYYFFHKLMN